MENDQAKKLLKLTRILLFANAAVWLVFGGLSFSRAFSGTSDLRFILSVLMVANAIAMIVLGVLLASGRAWVFFVAILYMALNVVLSITDQFGWVDALILLLNLIVLGFLFVTQQQMKQARVASQEA